MEAPDEYFLVQVESEQAIESRGCQEDRLLVSANLLTVIQILVLAGSLDFESAIVAEKFVASGNQNIFVAECNAAQAPVAAAALDVNLARVPVEVVLDFLFIKVDPIDAAVTSAPAVTTHDRCRDELW